MLLEKKNQVDAIAEEALRQRFNVETYPRILYWDAGFIGGKSITSVKYAKLQSSYFVKVLEKSCPFI